MRQRGPYATHVKRPLDVALALGGLVVLAPVLAIVALAVRIGLGPPVLFRQARPGRGGVLFDVYKFRTMRHAVDARGVALPDHQRMTRLGRLLRSSSLDELPELFNVLKGDMSLVGPRPLLVEYLPRYTRAQARRHEVRPGITGWAQVNGRNTLSWERRFELDVHYVDHIGLWLDMKIVLLTLWKAVRREGISAEGHVTMPTFTGAPSPEADSE
jgi:sugar transferase EpsL